MPLLDSIKPKHLRHIATTIRTALRILEKEHITIVHPDPRARHVSIRYRCANNPYSAYLACVRLSEREKFDRINTAPASSVICVSEGVAKERFGQNHIQLPQECIRQDTIAEAQTKYRAIDNDSKERHSKLSTSPLRYSKFISPFHCTLVRFVAKRFLMSILRSNFIL